MKELIAENAIVQFQLEDQRWVTGPILNITKDPTRKRTEIHLGGSYPSPINEITQVRILGPKEYFPEYDSVTILPVDLELEKKLSTIPKTYLSKIKRHGGKIVSMPEFLKKSEDIGGHLLGLDVDEYRIVSEYSGLEPFEKTYKKMGVDWELVDDHTNILMEHISGRSIVFLVPRSLFSYDTGATIDGENITRLEFLWLMNHPSALRNVTFVFGGYNSILVSGSTELTPAKLRKAVEKTLLSSQN
ncbi:MAG: hypothetical protein SGJ18_06560 [Pseudomonadota bacterium]|nr:hypothetical protein [Pseudomonadota bacterium]